MEHTFIYYGGGTEADLIARSGKPVQILRELGDDDRDPEVGRMFRVQFIEDGYEANVFADEIR
jgi:hypothetical protein